MPEKTPLLIFAVAGRIGSGCSFVSDSLSHSLASYGYAVQKVKVTSVLERTGDSFSSESERIATLQARGNEVRMKGDDALARKCLQDVVIPHINHNSSLSQRQAYILDSVKHKREVDVLRQIFLQSFYLVGVVASEGKRKQRLRERKHLSDDDITRLSETDAGITEGATQDTVKTVTRADYFFKNDYATRSDMNAEADRLMRRIFDIGIDSPTADEYGMHIAYQSSLRSACLSRQVGAALFSRDGMLLSTGHNDVPKHGGGLYGMDGSGQSKQREDLRCWAYGAKCYNDAEKIELAKDLCEKLVAENLLRPESVEQAIKVMFRSKLDSLIEFSRAVHAEMEAIISIARTGSNGLVGSTLYSTTYPCHNCAKHIIGAGVSRVVYREPYEKSLARKLHSDAISDAPRVDHVAFENYGGVGPQRYEEFFKRRNERKNGHGTFIDRDRDRISQLPVGAREADFITQRINAFEEAMLSETSSQQGNSKTLLAIEEGDSSPN